MLVIGGSPVANRVTGKLGGIVAGANLDVAYVIAQVI